MSNLRARVVGLAALVALAAAVIGFPAVLLAVDAVPSREDFAWSRLTAPDDGTLAVAVVGVVAWLAWLVITASVAIDLVARIRGISPPRVPGLAVPQLTAGRLIALASLLFVAAQLADQTLLATRTVAAAPAAAEPHEPVQLATHVEPAPVSSAPTARA